MSPRRRSPLPGTRSRILAAAAAEFAAHGFAATTVDRIARRARVNKAMIYYHFPNKRALYTAIVRDHFSPVVEKLTAIRAAPAPAAQQLDRFIDTFVTSIDASRTFLPLFLREIAEGGVHLGGEELALVAEVFGAVRAVLASGTEQRTFQPVHPSLAHFTLIAPVIMFRATAGIRQRLKKARNVDIPDADSGTLVRHMQMVARRILAPPHNEGRIP
jgi:TetR/AcrR family transcriptional regulator